jgi:glucosamine 6-phosphate synthetase-like amidotransferase/phosphosugar isomerase protein
VTGAGASALVAMEMAGQGTETGVPILAFTNNLGDMQPVSFAKGTGEEEAGLSRYTALAISAGDVVIGISASGGTGFVYQTLQRAREKGATTVAITENVDTPLGHAADYVIKSNAKPEGPSSSKVQAAHLAIGHALLVTLADERGVSADRSIEFMLPEVVPTKKMGIK